MNRAYQMRPIVGVGIVLIKQDLVLLAQRGKPPRMGAWSIPGGAVELGETLEQAARRELKEETNLEAGSLEFLDIVELIDRDEEERIRHHYTLIDYVAPYVGGDALAGDDAMAVDWFDRKKIAGLDLWDQTRRIIGMALDLRR